MIMTTKNKTPRSQTTAKKHSFEILIFHENENQIPIAHTHSHKRKHKMHGKNKEKLAAAYMEIDTKEVYRMTVGRNELYLYVGYFIHHTPYTLHTLTLHTDIFNVCVVVVAAAAFLLLSP